MEYKFAEGERFPYIILENNWRQTHFKKHWLEKNLGEQHITWNKSITLDRGNRVQWRFQQESDAFAFKLRWEGE